jgi:hypothetical protein
MPIFFTVLAVLAKRQQREFYRKGLIARIRLEASLAGSAGFAWQQLKGQIWT